jgi:hypothetical protein
MTYNIGIMFFITLEPSTPHRFDIDSNAIDFFYQLLYMEVQCTLLKTLWHKSTLELLKSAPFCVKRPAIVYIGGAVARDLL